MKKKYRIITVNDNKSIKKVLRTKSEDVHEITEDIKYLIKRMKELKTNVGVGLAAPQLGENLNIIIADDLENDNKQNIVLINPTWTFLSENMETKEEGCLSLPKRIYNKSRYTNIKVDALDENLNPISFEAKGLFARIIQHECDHLIGKLLCDA